MYFHTLLVSALCGGVCGQFETLAGLPPKIGALFLSKGIWLSRSCGEKEEFRTARKIES
jgi:hypothetical protein